MNLVSLYGRYDYFPTKAHTYIFECTHALNDTRIFTSE